MSLEISRFSLLWDSASIGNIWSSQLSHKKNKFYGGISISYGLNDQETLNLPDISAIGETAENSSIVKNESFESVDDPLNAHRAAGHETTLAPEILESLKTII